MAEGSITEQEYMDKLERFVRLRTKQVEDSNFQYALRLFFDTAAQYYKKPERAKTAHPQRMIINEEEIYYVKRFYHC